LGTTSPESKVLIVAGMHRSGTSLTANWLAHCGLDVGDDLLKRPLDNPTGHYEDLDFLHFHVDLLKNNGLDYLVFGDQKITTSADDRIKAQALIAARQGRRQWGWKDPRTTLVMDFWYSLLPDMKVLVVYRHYAQIADSLLRRDYKRATADPKFTRWARRLTNSRFGPVFKRLPWLLAGIYTTERFIRTRVTRLRYSFANLSLLRRYLHVWVRYNEDILRFADAHPDQVLLIHLDDLLPLSTRLVDYVNREWGFDLQSRAVDEVYAEGALHTGQMRMRELLYDLLDPACRRTYSHLMSWRVLTHQKLET
jgi:hypothetical protein